MTVPQQSIAETLHRFSRPEDRTPGRPAGGPTKQELYARAKELDIPRRSAMTKDELARAIARREG